MTDRHYSWNIFFLRKKNEFQLEFGTQKITTINQEKQKLEHILHLEPKDYHIDYVISMELLSLRRRRPFCEPSIAPERSGKRRLFLKVQIARLEAISELCQASVSRRDQV